jgi:hypothetical protein
MVAHIFVPPEGLLGVLQGLKDFILILFFFMIRSYVMISILQNVQRAG